MQGRFWASRWSELNLPDSSRPRFQFKDGWDRVRSMLIFHQSFPWARALNLFDYASTVPLSLLIAFTTAKIWMKSNSKLTLAMKHSSIAKLCISL